MKEYKYTIDGNKYEVAINEVNDTTAKVTVNGAEYTVEWEKPVEEKPVVKVKPAVAAKPAATEAPAAAPAAPVSGNAIKTPLPGTVIKVVAAAGDTVAEGDVILVMEAMKMEQEIKADKAGVIASIEVEAGNVLAADDVVATME